MINITLIESREIEGDKEVDTAIGEKSLNEKSVHKIGRVIIDASHDPKTIRAKSVKVKDIILGYLLRSKFLARRANVMNIL